MLDFEQWGYQRLLKCVWNVPIREECVENVRVGSNDSEISCGK